MIDKEFVPYEPALELKELGFDEPCIMAYIGKDKQLYSNCDDFLHLNAIDVLNPLKAPTFSQSFRWFREKCELYSCINNFTEELGNKKVYFIYEIRNPEQFELSETYNTYEEAELACLIKLIEIVKNK